VPLAAGCFIDADVISSEAEKISKNELTRVTVPICSGTVKRTMGVRQFLTRGLPNVAAEAALIFLAYNLKRLRKIHRNGTKNAEEAAQAFRAIVTFCCYVVFSAVILIFA